MAGSTSSARARQSSWRWPADSDRPRSVDRREVAARAARRSSSCAPTARAASLDLGVGGVGPAVGDVRATVPENRNGSWGT